MTNIETKHQSVRNKAVHVGFIIIIAASNSQAK
jgi:hypothetical protein